MYWRAHKTATLTPIQHTVQGSQGCQKLRFFLLRKLLSPCTKIARERHSLQKITKIEKKSQKDTVVLEFLESSSIWGQS